ncbi:MAG: hypothetical protein ACON5A_03675 [Candidatus Comchoanobacterales bacterium]
MKTKASLLAIMALGLSHLSASTFTPLSFLSDLVPDLSDLKSKFNVCEEKEKSAFERGRASYLQDLQQYSDSYFSHKLYNFVEMGRYQAVAGFLNINLFKGNVNAEECLTDKDAIIRIPKGMLPSFMTEIVDGGSEYDNWCDYVRLSEEIRVNSMIDEYGIASAVQFLSFQDTQKLLDQMVENGDIDVSKGGL